jgi:predicted PurR-regulated permease PerM
MTKIKIIGIIILLLLITLIFVSQNISEYNVTNNNYKDVINKQKSLTQEIAKDIFYQYRNKNIQKKNLNEAINIFCKNIEKIKSKTIVNQSKIFYKNILKFQTQIKDTSPYAKILLEKIVKDIYHTNLKLILEFDKLILLNKTYCKDITKIHKNIQYTLFFVLLISITFFLFYIFKTTSDINFLIKKISNTVKSIDQIENNVEEFLESIEESNIELMEKEDAVIESLDELINSQIKLKNLQIDLEKLIKNKS